MSMRLALLLVFIRVAEPATIAIVNARVWTGDRAQPWAEAIAAS